MVENWWRIGGELEELVENWWRIGRIGGRINQKKLCGIQSSNSVKGIGISPLRAEWKSTSQHAAKLSGKIQ